VIKHKMIILKVTFSCAVPESDFPILFI
jgi:hypothetical protein